MMIPLNWLQAPYPFEGDFADKRDTILSLSLFVSLILILLQPYGFVAANQVQMSGGYLVISICQFAVSFYSFPKLFPSWFKEDKWTVQRSLGFLLYNFFIIGLWIHVFRGLIIKDHIAYLISGEELLVGVSKVMMIGLGASLLLILIRYNLLARKHLQVSQELNQQLRDELFQMTPMDKEETIELFLENKPVVFYRADLNFVKSEGNYISLHLATKDKHSNKLYRAKMKETTEALSSFPEFFRCHRSFLVNLNRIKSLHGNSQGLFIKVIGEETQIPVARPNIRFLRKRMSEKMG